MLKLHIEYFSVLRTQRGVSAETIETAAIDPLSLWAELGARHGIQFHREHCAVAVNDEYAQWDTRLSDGDRVVFIPPVSGG